RHEHEPVRLGMFDAELDVRPAARLELLDGVVDVRAARLDVLAERPELLLAHRQQKGALVGKVEVDRRRRHADGVGHGANRHRLLVAGLEEQPAGGGEDLGVQQFSLAAPVARSGPGRGAGAGGYDRLPTSSSRSFFLRPSARSNARSSLSVAVEAARASLSAYDSRRSMMTCSGAGSWCSPKRS